MATSNHFWSESACLFHGRPVCSVRCAGRLSADRCKGSDFGALDLGGSHVRSSPGFDAGGPCELGPTERCPNSRARRFTGRLAEFLRLRDRTCRTPWRDAPIRHLDHAEDHDDGGPTSAANGQGLCQACNHAKQARGWSAAAPGTPAHRRDHHTDRAPLPIGGATGELASTKIRRRQGRHRPLACGAPSRMSAHGSSGR